jgi:hypothetical protein
MPIRVRVQPGPRAAVQETNRYPLWYNTFGFGSRMQSTPKPTPANLSRFAEHPIVRRAINVTKNPVAALKWKVTSAPGLEMTPDMEKRAAIATNCFSSPNKDDSFRSLVEQVVDDTMTYAGAIEARLSSDPFHPLWLFPVDGSSIRLFPGWSGGTNEARYAQYTGYVGQEILLRNDELIYIRMNPRTSTPFGLTPVEVAFNLINAFVSSFDFAARLAGNQSPSQIIDLGPNVTDAQVAAFRTYWQDSVEGQGETPIIGGADNPAEGAKGAMAQVLNLAKGDDSDMRLAWQGWLVRLIALAFDVSPQKLNLETTVNRATAEEMAEGDDDSAIRPMARLIAEYLTREALGRKLGWYDLAFEWVGLTPEDDESRAKIWGDLIDHDVLLPDDARHELGLEPLPNGRGALTKTESLVLIAAARAVAPPNPSPDAGAGPAANQGNPDDQPRGKRSKAVKTR